MARLALVVALILAPSLARADAVDDHLTEAVRLESDEALTRALDEYRAAFALRPAPALLLAMARVERRLGHVPQALALYRRFLAESDAVAARDEAVRAIAALERLPATSMRPPAAPSPARFELVRYERKPRWVVIGVGIPVLLSGYVAAAVIGGFYTEASCDGFLRPDCTRGNPQVGGGLLFVPVIGPVAASLAYREADFAAFMLVLDLPAQIAGLAMIIAGARYKFVAPVQIVPSVSAQAVGLTVSGRF